MLVEALALLGIAFVGSVFWLVSPEASSVYYGAKLGWHPLAVGALVAAGQAPMYVMLYYGGERWAMRWKWLARVVARTRRRYQARMERSYMVLTAVGAVTGLPPVIAMCALASAFDIRFARLFPVVVLCRVLRFTVLASGGWAFTS
jgi:membrane protein YqaA with SNARE-associated domain